MELKTAIETRASVRHYTDDPVPEADLREMVRLAGLAPSANNSQPWHFIAITNRALLASMAESVHQKVQTILPETDEPSRQVKAQVDWFSTFFGGAPAVVAVAIGPYEAIVDRALAGTGLTHDEMNAMRGYPDVQSLGAGIQNLVLAAVDLGYGACWLSGPLIARDELEAFIQIDRPWKLAAMVAIGKPASEVNPRAKKPVEEIFEFRG